MWWSVLLKARFYSFMLYVSSLNVELAKFYQNYIIAAGKLHKEIHFSSLLIPCFCSLRPDCVR